MGWIGSKVRGIAITARGYGFLIQDHERHCRACRCNGQPCAVRLELQSDLASAEAREGSLPVLAPSARHAV